MGVLEEYVNNVVEQLYEKKRIFGYVTIDFIAYPMAFEGDMEEMVIEGIGIDCFYTNYTSSFVYFDYLMQGSFDPKLNIYKCHNLDNALKDV